MAGISLNLIITLNVNVLHTSIIRQRLAKRIKNINQPHANYEKLTSNISRLKVKGWKIICQANNQKKAGVIRIKSEKVNFRAKNLLDRQGNNDKSVSPSRTQSNPKHVHIKKQTRKTCDAKIDKRRSRQIHNYN